MSRCVTILTIPVYRGMVITRYCFGYCPLFSLLTAYLRYKKVCEICGDDHHHDVVVFLDTLRRLSQFHMVYETLFTNIRVIHVLKQTGS